MNLPDAPIAQAAFFATLMGDAALMRAGDGVGGDVELRRWCRLPDKRRSTLVAAVNLERIAWFPNGRLFLIRLSRHLPRWGARSGWVNAAGGWMPGNSSSACRVARDHTNLRCHVLVAKSCDVYRSLRKLMYL